MRTWITIAILLALLMGAIYVGYVGWSLTEVAMPVTGYIAMALGIFFSLIVGGGPHGAHVL